jgi:hypothetical protein
MATVRVPLENTERRNQNLRWLRLHFRALNDIGRLPFNNADLWQLHQYYFSPPLNSMQHDDVTTVDSKEPSDATVSRPINLETRNASSLLERTVSFQALDSAILFGGAMNPSNNVHKRRSNDTVKQQEEEHASKRPKNLKPRIAYYPRILVSCKNCIKLY